MKLRRRGSDSSRHEKKKMASNILSISVLRRNDVVMVGQLKVTVYSFL